VPVRGLRRTFGVLVLLAAFVTLTACGSDGSASQTTASSTSVPQRLATPATTVGAAAWGVAVDATREVVWVSDPARGVLVTVDRDGQPIGEHTAGDTDQRAAGLQVADGRVWIANLGGTITALDSTTGARVAGVEVGPGEPAALLVRDGVVWVPLHGPEGGLARLDVSTLEPLPPVRLPESAFAVTDGGRTRVWVAGLDRRAFAIDAGSGEVERTVEVGAAPRGIAAGLGSVWVTARDDEALIRLDADSGEVEARIEVDGQPWPVAFGGGFVWVGTLDGRVLQIDPMSDEIIATVDTAPRPMSIAVGLGAVWVASQTGSLTRIEID